MIECMCFAAEHSDVPFLHVVEEDDADTQHRKDERLGQLLAIDPDGAGGEGWVHWTGWGPGRPVPLDAATARRIIPALEREVAVDESNPPTRRLLPHWLSRLADAEEVLGNKARAAELRVRADEVRKTAPEPDVARASPTPAQPSRARSARGVPWMTLVGLGMLLGVLRSQCG